MTSLMRRVQVSVNDSEASEAATAVEYAIMVGLIAAVVIVAAVFLGDATEGTFECTQESMEQSDERC